jgi:hypothetical protein
MHVNAGSLDRPQDFAPEDRNHAAERLPRLRLAGGLPQP